MQFVLWEVGILTFLLWLIAVGFVVFSGLLFYRQQVILRHLLIRLTRLEAAVVSPKQPPVRPAHKTQLSILKDEPIAKYESVTLPDDVQISFVEKE